MTEVTREIVHDRKGASGFIAWLALLLAIAALTLAWLAYNRSGQDLETRIRNQLNQLTNQAQEETKEVKRDVNNNPSGPNNPAN